VCSKASLVAARTTRRFLVGQSDIWDCSGSATVWVRLVTGDSYRVSLLFSYLFVLFVAVGCSGRG
jgi:hypothetical protein